MTQLFTADELVGKTISLFRSYDERCAIHFTDGSFAIIDSDSDYDGTPTSFLSSAPYRLPEVSSIATSFEAVQLGFMTTLEGEVFNEKCAELKAKEQEAAERKSFELLKLKFGEK